MEHCIQEEGTDLVYPNPMIANICKYQFADNWHTATKYLQDIAGGIMVTAPSAKDLLNVLSLFSYLIRCSRLKFSYFAAPPNR